MKPRSTFQLNQSQHTLSLHANAVAGRVWFAATPGGERERYCRQLHLPGIVETALLWKWNAASCSSCLITARLPFPETMLATDQRYLTVANLTLSGEGTDRLPHSGEGCCSALLEVWSELPPRPWSHQSAEPADCMVQLSESQLFAHFLTDILHKE